jgi:hypothetical protein
VKRYWWRDVLSAAARLTPSYGWRWPSEVGGRFRVPVAPTYPHPSGDVIVLGPMCFVKIDGSVLNWKGQNYVPQWDACPNCGGEYVWCPCGDAPHGWRPRDEDAGALTADEATFAVKVTAIEGGKAVEVQRGLGATLEAVRKWLADTQLMTVERIEDAGALTVDPLAPMGGSE